MISNKLTDTQVEILSGSALVEVDEILKDNRIAVKMGDSETVLLKTGLYHFNADAGQVRAFDGKAQVSAASNSTELKGGRTLLVASSLTPDKFDKNKSKDELYLWSEQRDYRLALANISVARSTNANSFSIGNSLWAWDPWLSMYTFLPRSGYMYSPFGIAWYSPETVWIVFRPAYNDSNAGYQGNSPPATLGGRARRRHLRPVGCPVFERQHGSRRRFLGLEFGRGGVQRGRVPGPLRPSRTPFPRVCSVAVRMW